MASKADLNKRVQRLERVLDTAGLEVKMLRLDKVHLRERISDLTGRLARMRWPWYRRAWLCCKTTLRGLRRIRK